MCGRYTLTNPEDVIGEMQVSIASPGSAEARARNALRRYNRPDRAERVVEAALQRRADAARPGRRSLRDGARALEMMRWGLVPHWAGKARRASRR